MLFYYVLVLLFIIHCGDSHLLKVKDIIIIIII